MEQWLLISHCIYCNAPLYELSTPTSISWIGTGRYKWRDNNFDCLHKPNPEDVRDEVS